MEYVTGNIPEYHYIASNQTVYKWSSGWIGFYKSTNDPKFRADSGFVTFDHCPLWYCNNKSTINVNETDFDQDTQCNNRRGILCGACRESRSLAIASTNCIVCDHPQFSIPVFVVGILAITVIVLFFMLCFNVTITDGTISGLLVLC